MLKLFARLNVQPENWLNGGKKNCHQIICKVAKTFGVISGPER